MKKNILISSSLVLAAWICSGTVSAQSSAATIQQSAPVNGQVIDVDPVSTEATKSFIVDEKGDKVYFSANPYAAPSSKHQPSEQQTPALNNDRKAIAPKME